VCRALASEGYTVRACVRNPGDDVKTSHLKAMTGKGKLELWSGDLMEPGSYDSSFKGSDAVVHCAARVHEQATQDMIASHLEGTKHVLESAKKAGTVKRFVQTSSVAAIMDPVRACSGEKTEFTEEDWADNATLEVGAFYAIGKRDAERMVMQFAKEEGVSFDVVCINPGLVIGECLCKAHTKASPVFIRELLYGNPQPQVFFPWVDATEVAAAHHRALTRPEAAGQRFIVVGDSSSRPELAASKLRELYPTYKVENLDLPWWKRLLMPILAWSYDAKTVQGEMRMKNDKSKSVLGLQYTPLEESLKRTVDSMVTPGWVKPRLL